MKTRALKSFVYCLLLTLIACTTGHCRRDGSIVEKNKNIKPPSGYETRDIGTTMVAKPDGSLQCGFKPGVPLEEMAKELKNVKIISSKKLNDGLMRIQACGATTGMMNVYEIHKQDVGRAQQLGFSIFHVKGDNKNVQ